MTNKENLKKKIIYRSQHRGTKEMDLLLGSFVKKHINNFNELDLEDLNQMLFIDDEIISKWYFDKDDISSIPKNNVSKLLKNFKI